MSLMSVDASSLAHGLHYAVLAVGLLGLAAVLGPQWVGGRRPIVPRTEHELRVVALQRQIAAGSLGNESTPFAAETLAAPIRTAGALLPIAIISSTAAAGVHAAVGPGHFREVPAFGLFFAGAAIAQMVWSVAMVMMPSRRLLLAGVIGNAAMIVLWGITRSVGLPFGLLPTPEPIGAWDLCCGAWEAVVVVTGALLLRRKNEAVLRLPAYNFWPRSARAWMIASTITLGVLSVSGAGS